MNCKSYYAISTCQSTLAGRPRELGLNDANSKLGLQIHIPHTISYTLAWPFLNYQQSQNHLYFVLFPLDRLRALVREE